MAQTIVGALIIGAAIIIGFGITAYYGPTQTCIRSAGAYVAEKDIAFTCSHR